jgi:hypothetical protein
MDKKRSGVPPVSRVAHGGVRYESLHWGKSRGLGQNGGYVIAVDERTGDERWTLKVYDVPYEEGLEPDKQDVFITKLTLSGDGRRLLVDDERGRRHAVNLADRSVEDAGAVPKGGLLAGLRRLLGRKGG